MPLTQQECTATPSPRTDGTELTSGEDAGAGPRAEGCWAEDAHVRLTPQVRTLRTQAWPVGHPQCASPPDEGSAGLGQPPGSCCAARSRQAQRGSRRTGHTGRPQALSHQPERKADLTTPLLPKTLGTKSQLLAEVTVLAPRAFHLRAFATRCSQPGNIPPQTPQDWLTISVATSWRPSLTTPSIVWLPSRPASAPALGTSTVYSVGALPPRFCLSAQHL